MDINTIIEQTTAALGGAARLTSVRSMRFNGSIVEPEFAIENFNVIRMKPYFQKVWLTVDDGVFSEGYNGEAAWEKPVGQKHGRVADGAAGEALRHAMQLPGIFCTLTEFLRRGNALEIVGEETIEGRETIVLRAVLLDGFEKVYYLDAETYLLNHSRDVRALHPNIDPTAQHIETMLSDFREVDGVTVPFHETQRDWITGELLSQLTWRTVEINPPLTEKDFEIP